MDKTFEQNYEEKREELLEKTHETGIFDGFLGTEHIPTESLAAMGSNTTLGEFFAEMKKHGLEVHIKPKEKKPRFEPMTEEKAAAIRLAGDDTPEHRRHYGKVRQEALERMGDVGFIESVLEAEPAAKSTPLNEGVLEELSSAGYQGDPSELRKLAKELKEKHS